MSQRISFWRYNGMRIISLFTIQLLVIYALQLCNLYLYFNNGSIALIIFLYSLTIYFVAGSTLLLIIISLFNFYKYKTKRTERWL